MNELASAATVGLVTTGLLSGDNGKGWNTLVITDSGTGTAITRGLCQRRWSLTRNCLMFDGG